MGLRDCIKWGLCIGISNWQMCYCIRASVKLLILVLLRKLEKMGLLILYWELGLLWRLKLWKEMGMDSRLIFGHLVLFSIKCFMDTILTKLLIQFS